MWKHIIIQSICQIIILVALYFTAPKFVKEQNLVRLAENRIINFCYSEYPGEDLDNIIYGIEVKWTRTGRLIHDHKLLCGKYMVKQNLKEAYNEYISSNCASTHMSMIFDIFVFYTLFNQFNCRVIDDSLNIFVRMTRSLLFPLICLGKMGLQVLIIYIGKAPFHIVNEGFTVEQFFICIGFSAITFVVSFFVKFIPLQLFIDRFTIIKDEEEEESKTSSEKEEKAKILENKNEKLSNGANGKKNEDDLIDDKDSERNLNEIIYKKES